MNHEEILFSIEDLEKRLAEKLQVPVHNLRDIRIDSLLRPALEVICDEINDVRKVLRRKI